MTEFLHEIVARRENACTHSRGCGCALCTSIADVWSQAAEAMEEMEMDERGDTSWLATNARNGTNF